ncbi:MAG TPA: phosphonopyruvate decarboxylase [Candidatus Nanoarchaeia archaeon]|nr:phosphonopyruvate decarboxylase [Candidatus Nanoarchaeia archaeon]
MIDAKILYESIIENGSNLFTGVPDSLLAHFCAYITDNSKNHIICANEGNAIALAAGYHLATKQIGVVYMQNSGLGNCVNPLTSLTDADVYSIPVLLVIGWRGEREDEPQHKKMGKITLDQLDTLGIPYSILPQEGKELKEAVDKAYSSMKGSNTPYALVVREGTFNAYPLKSETKVKFELSREEAIKLIAGNLKDDDIIVSTTGKASREVFAFREELGHDHKKDFLTVGSMGHSSSIALGIALSRPGRNVYCFDGDGAVIMHMGVLAIIGDKKPKNLRHIIFNNGSHDSVGGQPTAAFNIDLPAIAKACGYTSTACAETPEDIKGKLSLLQSIDGPSLLEIKINKGARVNLGRPTITPIENKKAFMEYISRG